MTLRIRRAATPRKQALESSRGAGRRTHLGCTTLLQKARCRVRVGDRTSRCQLAPHELAVEHLQHLLQPLLLCSQAAQKECDNPNQLRELLPPEDRLQGGNEDLMESTFVRRGRRRVVQGRAQGAYRGAHTGGRRDAQGAQRGCAERAVAARREHRLARCAERGFREGARAAKEGAHACREGAGRACRDGACVRAWRGRVRRGGGRAEVARTGGTQRAQGWNTDGARAQRGAHRGHAEGAGLEHRRNW